MEKASELLKGKIAVVTPFIQANWGEHLGYVGYGPISKWGNGFRVATSEELCVDPLKGETFTDYGGFDVINDTILDNETLFHLIKDCHS